LLAIDVSEPSLREIEGLGMENVTTERALVEDFQPSQRFDWIVMSEILEHLRRPAQVLSRCFGWLTSGGSLVLTTPNGHWESDEHLHEFDLGSLSALLATLGAESFQAGYVRDRAGRRRWLVARILAPQTPPAADDFHRPWSAVRERRRKK
jgi:2-polyprenyl-3-methyl-5-hydroxy-6-metoxy-1,4-benzoquinol methylase